MARINLLPPEPQLADCSAMMRMLDPLLLGQGSSTASKRQLLADLFRLIGSRIDTAQRSGVGSPREPAVTPSAPPLPGADQPGGSTLTDFAPLESLPSSSQPPPPASLSRLSATVSPLVATLHGTTHQTDPAQEKNLSPRVEQTLRCLLVGMSEKEAAHELGLSPHTVHVYVKTLYRRFHVSTRAELLARHMHQ